MEQPRLIVMAGAPGSGKSTYVEENFPGAAVVSADHFMVNAEGVYEFYPKKLSLVHRKCRQWFYTLVAEKAPFIVVDNTNSQPEEVRTFTSYAARAGYQIRVVIILANPMVATVRGIHGAPYETVRRVNRNCERLSGLLPDLEVEVVDHRAHSH